MSIPIREQLAVKEQELELAKSARDNAKARVKMCEINIAEYQRQIEVARAEKDKWESEYDEYSTKYNAIDDEITELKEAREEQPVAVQEVKG